MGDALSEFFDVAASPENPFSILETLEEASRDILPFTPYDEPVFSPKADDDERSAFSSKIRPLEAEDDDEEARVSRKKVKLVGEDGQHKIMSHISVERNRRKQMNENLTVLRSLMPCFYVKRGDQASIVGGVVDYIKELQQVLQSLEAKKQRKVYSEVLSPRPALSSSPRPLPLSPRPILPMSPRKGLPISPRTPQPGSPYKPRNTSIQQQPAPPYVATSVAALSRESSPAISLDNSVDMLTVAVINSKSSVADVEVKFSGPNVMLKTMSQRIPGQAAKIIAALEGQPLEILQVSIDTVDDTNVNSFTVKIGIECELSAEELAQEIQQTFS